MKRLAGLALVLLVVVSALWMVTHGGRVAPPPPGIELVATIRAEPTSFSRLFAGDRASLIVSQLVHEPLVRVNHVTQALEPALASSWTEHDGGHRVRLALRTGVRFS